MFHCTVIVGHYSDTIALLGITITISVTFKYAPLFVTKANDESGDLGPSSSRCADKAVFLVAFLREMSLAGGRQPSGHSLLF